MAPKPAIPKLPNMNEFSPSVVGDLRTLLRSVAAHSGDRVAQTRAVLRVSTIKPAPNGQHLNRANNVLIGMSQCGLFDLGQHQLTPTGANLLETKDDQELNQEFARHLLRNCHGADLLHAVDAVRAQRLKVTLQAIREQLKTLGFRVTFNEGNPSKIRLWLEMSGVVNAAWQVNQAAYRELMGIAMDTEDDWAGLTEPQRAFLCGLRQLVAGDSKRWVDGSHLMKVLKAQYSERYFPEGSFRAEVLAPLEKRGWISTRAKGAGRGGKIGEIIAADKLLEIKASLPIEIHPYGVPRDLLKLLNTPLAEIAENLDSGDIGTKGLALELLCLHLCRDIGLRPVGFRNRARDGKEVDLIADGVHLHYSRWILQCKNTPKSKVGSDYLAREIGMASLLKAHVVVMVTTGEFARTVFHFASICERDTGLQVVLIDGAALRDITNGGSGKLIDLLKDQARDALELKKQQVRDVDSHDE